MGREPEPKSIEQRLFMGLMQTLAGWYEYGNVRARFVNDEVSAEVSLEVADSAMGLVDDFTGIMLEAVARIRELENPTVSEDEREAARSWDEVNRAAFAFLIEHLYVSDFCPNAGGPGGLYREGFCTCDKAVKDPLMYFARMGSQYRGKHT